MCSMYDQICPLATQAIYLHQEDDLYFCHYCVFFEEMPPFFFTPALLGSCSHTSLCAGTCLSECYWFLICCSHLPKPKIFNCCSPLWLCLNKEENTKVQTSPFKPGYSYFRDMLFLCGFPQPTFIFVSSRVKINGLSIKVKT